MGLHIFYEILYHSRGKAGLRQSENAIVLRRKVLSNGCIDGGYEARAPDHPLDIELDFDRDKRLEQYAGRQWDPS